MKNIKFIFIFLFMFISILEADVIEKKYTFADYQIFNSRGYQTINFSNTLLKGNIGEPLLPYRAISLLLPSGQAVVSIEVIKDDLQAIPGKFKISPKQPARRYSGNVSDDFRLDKAVYSIDGIYPVVSTGKVTTEYMNGFGFALGSFTPVEYNPVTGKFSYYKNITIRVHTGPQLEDHLENVKLSQAILTRVRAIAQNPEVLDNYSAASLSDADYQLLIITTNSFINSFSTLRYHYLMRGLKAKVVDLAAIESSTDGIDSPEKIRNYIIQEYKNNGVEYVLLGGDSDLIPYRGLFCEVQSGGVIRDNAIPADIYYSALDGNWNTNEDALWGEIGEDDLLPDVAVGRLPFSDMVDFDRMIHKVISYQAAPVTGRLRNPLLAGEKAWEDPESWGADYIEQLVGSHTDNAYTTAGIPADHNITRLYDRDQGKWGYQILIDEINQGHSYLYHTGHSNYFYNMRMNLGTINETNFKNLNGITHNYLNIYSHGCNSGGFDRSDCVAEHMLKLETFAVSYVGNSRYGWFNEGQTEGPSLHLNREYVHAIYSEKMFHLGEAHLMSKVRSASWVNAPNQHEEGALRWCFYGCNVLGDPAMAIWTDEPRKVTAVYELNLNKESGSIQVSVQVDDLPVSGMMCALIQDSTLLGRCLTNENGLAEITLVSQTITEGQAEIVVSGYNCLPTVFPLTVTDVVDVQYLQPTGPNLVGSYPNPFNPETTIEYNTVKNNPVLITIYNTRGQLVATLVDKLQNAGSHEVIWRGRSDKGEEVKSGVYYCRLSTEGFVKTVKLLLVR